MPKGHEETFLGDGNNLSSLIVVVVTGVYGFIRIGCAKNESTLLFGKLYLNEVDQI